MGKIKNFKMYEKCLIIVDMVNGFVNEGVLHDEEIKKTVPRQLELIKQYKAEGQLIIFIKDTHTPDSTEFERFGDTNHCIKGTTEQELIPELKEYENDDNVISIEKNSTSFMESPDFRSLVEELVNVEEFDVCGCCTDICVANGTIGLSNYLNQKNKKAAIRVHQDATATYAEASRKKYSDAAYLLMEQQGIQLVKKKVA